MSDILHIYSQKEWHEDAFIVGTKEKLIKLKQSIEIVLSESKNNFISFVNDGEEYHVNIICIKDEFVN